MKNVFRTINFRPEEFERKKEDVPYVVLKK